MHLDRTLNAKLDYINIPIVQFHYFLAKIARKVTIYLVEWLSGGMGQGRVRENHTWKAINFWIFNRVNLGVFILLLFVYITYVLQYLYTWKIINR